MNQILTPYTQKGLSLKNHLVMAPMTRSRATGNVPNSLMAEYYGQRSGAGLIITEGTSPAPEGLGYANIPGMFSKAQVEGWKLVTSAVHARGAKFFVQLMHSGRIGHTDNLPRGARLVGASDIKAAGQIPTAQGMQDISAPVALTTAGVKKVIDEYTAAAKNAVEAGFDGVEMHGANGYLIEQFLNPNVNNRTDEYGGSIEARAKFTIDIAHALVAAIGKERVGIRFSPYSELGDLAAYGPDEVHETYRYLAHALNEIGIVYIHVALSAKIPQRTLDAIRSEFKGALIICNGLTPESAVAYLNSGFADLVAFGKAFLANPDLDKRIAIGAGLNQPDFTTLYTGGEKGYTDYPALA